MSVQENARLHEPVLSRQLRRDAESMERSANAVLSFCSKEAGPWSTTVLVQAVAEENHITPAEVREGLWRLTGEGTLRFIGNLGCVGKATLR